MAYPSSFVGIRHLVILPFLTFEEGILVGIGGWAFFSGVMVL